MASRPPECMRPDNEGETVTRRLGWRAFAPWAAETAAGLTGVLVLSSFAGAWHALQMQPIKKRERMRVMREQVRARNLYRWTGRMPLDCPRTRQDQRIRELASQNAA